jgi:putative flavoprotein involved in K+ transport
VASRDASLTRRKHNTRFATKRYDVVVIGAGQAGLAIGFYLARQDRRFVILDGTDAIGAVWRSRWDSLVLFTPRRYNALPGLAFPGDPDGYPTRDEVITYLNQYAADFELPIELGSRVRSLTRRDGTFFVELESGNIEADHVVVATGSFQTPRVPDFAGQLAPEVFQTHSAGYRNPGGIPGGTVLVVGGGNTGFQIAQELSATHRVHLSVGGRQMPLPQRVLGRDLFWWLVTTKLFKTTVDSRLGQKLSRRDALIGSSPRAIKRHGVTLEPRTTAASGRTITFVDGRTLDVDAVIWATGFGLDHSWIDLPLADPEGRIRQRRGVTDTEGLYFLGLPWQHTRGSALLGWVSEDAAYLAERIAAQAANTGAQPLPALAAVAVGVAETP